MTVSGYEDARKPGRKQRKMHNPHADYTSVGSAEKLGFVGMPMTYDEYAANFREERTRREEEAKRHAMSCEERSIGQAEEDLELVMREYGHVPLSADDAKLIAVDECKEMTQEDFENLQGRTSISLPPGSEFAQTANDHRWWQYVDEEEAEHPVDNP